VRISALNTFLHGDLPARVLPLAGVHLPYAKTPGRDHLHRRPPARRCNLNLEHLDRGREHFAIGCAAVGSLAFLVVIHKLEYFLNARIVGERIRAKAWEILLGCC